MRPVERPAFLVADGATLDELLTGIRSVLSTAFAVRRATATHTISRTWLDTFDWRLYRAGLTLEHRAERGTSELVLAAADMIQPAPGWRLPAKAGIELPPGPVATRIAQLIAPRALIRVAAVRSAVTTLALLNADGKTVARIEVDIPEQWGAVLRPPARLTVTEVRGYPAQARRAVTLLAATPGIEPAATPPFEALAERRPGEYTGKVDAPITASQPAPVAVSIVLLNLLDTLEANVDGVLRDIDSEFLHDLRVSVRRTRSALKLLGDTLAGLDAEHFSQEFRWLGDVTTPLRDLDVHLLEFDDMADAAQAAAPEDLEPVRAYLERARIGARRRLARELRSPRFAALTGDWRKALVEVRDGRPRRGTRTVRTVAARKTRAAYDKVLKKGAAITPDSPPESLHDLRKRAKELRYALEFFAPLHPAEEYAKALGDLKKLQDCLGEYQDTQVQIEEIRAQAEAMLSDRAHPVSAATLLAMGEIIAGLGQRQRAARDVFARRFAAFTSVQSRRRFARLLGQ